MADRTELVGEATRVAQLIADRGTGGRERRLLPFPSLLRCRGGQPHPRRRRETATTRSRCRFWSARSTIRGSGTRSPPTGIPGATILNDRGSPADPAALDWSKTGLVSVFVRDRIGHEPCLRGATKRSAVQVHDPGARAADPLRFAEQIRQNDRLGYHVEALHGPDTSVEQRVELPPCLHRDDARASRPLSATSSSRTTSGRSSASTARGCS